eukprot:jgi/Botrbrau1/14773/Bobra.0284s0007.1
MEFQDDCSCVEFFNEATTADVLARYELGEELGVGGFSVVRRGRERCTAKEVAIKAIEKAKYDSSCSLLQREIDVLSKVAHPSCVRLFAVYNTSKFVYLVTELATGGELLDRILQYGAYSEAEAANILQRILSALSFLHARGIVHRDLKLENILLTDKDQHATEVKIADFGLSRFCNMADGEGLTTMCGSPAYVAPEILSFSQSKKEYSIAVDMWSAGIILFVLVTGYSPFSADSDAELFDHIRTGAYDVSDPMWEKISDEAKDLVGRMLCVDPVQRLTAEEALEHPWIRQHCSDDIMWCSPQTPSPQDPSRNPQKEAHSVQLELVLGELGSMALETPVVAKPAKLASLSFHAQHANAVFRGSCGMRSRAASDAGDEFELQQPDTPEQAERERPSLALEALMDASFL